MDEAKALTEGGIKDEPYFVEMCRWQGKSILNRENEVTPYNLREIGKSFEKLSDLWQGRGEPWDIL